MVIGSRGIAVIIFLVSLLAIVMIKPKFLINSDTSEWKEFGFGDGKSCFSLFTISVIIAIFSYLITFVIV